MGTSELHHAKTGLKIFVAVIPKEGLIRLVPGKPSFGKAPTKMLRPVFARQGSCMMSPFKESGAVSTL